MSTAGKVLTILIMLSMLGWIVLASLVAEHNVQWGKRVAEVTKQVEELKAPIPGLKADLFAKTSEANAAQVALERARRDFRANLAMAQRSESMSKEDLTRENFQLAAATAQAQAAQKRHDTRRSEVDAFNRQIAQEQSTVRELQDENKKLKDEMTALYKKFLDLNAENRQMVDRLTKKSGATASNGRPTRSTSMTY